MSPLSTTVQPPLLGAAASISTAPRNRAAPPLRYATVFDGARRTMLRPQAEDWMVGVYLLGLWGAVVAGNGPRRTFALGVTTIVLAVYSLLQAVAHQHPLRSTRRELLRRLALVFGLLAPFGFLHHILAAVTTHTVDTWLYDFDLAVFGLEPALAWDRYVEPVTTEWFSFFYLSYYFVILAFLAPFVFLARSGRLVQEFAFGLLFVFCVGQTMYMLVPGYGPHVMLASRFEHALEGPFWWRLVATTVHSGQARADIFPSLHTAAPAFFTMFSLRHRHLPIFRLTWPITALVASQIIIATMFLRWHYAIDIVAGLGLAGLGQWAATKVAARNGAGSSAVSPSATAPCAAPDASTARASEEPPGSPPRASGVLLRTARSAEAPGETPAPGL